MIKNFFKTDSILKLRNLFGLRPTIFNVNYLEKGMSYSDGFFWRLDDNFKTILRFTNIINLYFSKNSSIEIYFYDDKNNFLNSVKLNSDKINREINVTADIVKKKKFGVFYIFHKSNYKIESIIRNSCYVGFSYKKSLYSFVHGNTISAKNSISPNSKQIQSGMMSTSFIRKNYFVQNSFCDSQIEIMLQNSSNKTQKITVNNYKTKLLQGHAEIININNDEIVKISSNCYFLRPIVFEYKNNYLNVYHA